MEMEQSTYTRSDQKSRPQYHPPPPVAIPRSQYANNTRSTSHRPVADVQGPRYFSSPLRAPLHRKERHDSLVEHQKSLPTSNAENDAFSKPQIPQDIDRSSYTFFQPHAAVRPLRINKKPLQLSSDADPSDIESQSSQDQPGVVRQASIGHKATPALTNVKRSNSTRTTKQDSEVKDPPNMTINSKVLSTTESAALRFPARPDSLRMRPETPTSTYSQDLQHDCKHPKSSITLRNTDRESVPLESIQTPARSLQQNSSSFSGPTAYSEKSPSSANLLLGLGIDHQGMNKRIPEEARPPRLNMRAVEDLSSRGSITSLPDLIRRATRLAANLDRGKTASRLGMLDMFGNTEHGVARRRESTYTDMLDSFPDPANSTPSKTPRPTTMWPRNPKERVMVSERQVSGDQRRTRKCCGLSVTTFVIVAVIIILIVAAAVLIPIFLIAVPRETQSTTSLRNCPATSPCQNNGLSIVDDNACSCICVDGFTGSDCSQSADPNCATADIVDGSHTYHNATLGNSIVSLLAETEIQMNIAINGTVLLSTFANHNLSCASENSLVQFDLSRRPREKRLIVRPQSQAKDAAVPDQHVAARVNKDEVSLTAAAIGARGTTDSNSVSITYQKVSTPISATTQTSEEAITTASGTTTAAGSASTATANITSDQLNFARLVVLYVLAESRTPSTAVVAQQRMEQYFLAGALASGNTTVNVVNDEDDKITANFANLSLTLTNGNSIGGV